MRSSFAVALMLGACSASTMSLPPVGAAHHVPDALRACPATPTQAPVPKPPRTFESVIAYANANEDQRAKTEQALEVCRQKLIELLAVIERSQ